MILWRLRGYSDSDSDLEGKDVVCSLQKWKCGYRLLVEHGGDVTIDENHVHIDAARGKAEMFRAELIKQGWQA